MSPHPSAWHSTWDMTVACPLKATLTPKHREKIFSGLLAYLKNKLSELGVSCNATEQVGLLAVSRLLEEGDAAVDPAQPHARRRAPTLISEGESIQGTRTRRAGAASLRPAQLHHCTASAAAAPQPHQAATAEGRGGRLQLVFPLP